MINNLITPMNFTLVQASICELLAKERDKQEEIAFEKGFSEEYIHQNIDFTIYPKRFRIPDVQYMPCVFVYFDNLDFPTGEQSPSNNYALANLNVDYFCCGKAELCRDDSENFFSISADDNAEDRLNYLTAQIYKILFSEQNYRKNTCLVDHVKPKQWQRIMAPNELNQAATVLGASFTCELGFNEPTILNDTIKIKELYINLDIRDEFLSPLIRKNFT